MLLNAPLPSILGGLAFCRQIERLEFYPQLLAKTGYLHRELDAILARLGLPVQVLSHGARFGLLLGLEEPPVNYENALAHCRE